MKIKVWKCSEDKCITPCILPYDKDHVTPDGCFWGGVSNFKEVEIEATELISYFAKPCEHYYLTQMCDIRGGICPKECDGNLQVCLQKEGIQRSIRK